MVRIRSATPLDGYRLRLEFTDGTVGDVDLSRELWGPVFEPLRDPSVFRQVRVDPRFGTVVWPGDVDLDPDVLYAQATGSPIPTPAGEGPREVGRTAA